MDAIIAWAILGLLALIGLGLIYGLGSAINAILSRLRNE